MKNKLFALFVCMLTGLSTAWADLPFRNHRYDAFKTLRTSTDNNIVFIGNSITNMHEWWEAFGNANIVNRGVSGAVSDEVVANLGSLVSGHPGKVFLMIGTNDLGTSGINNAAHVAGNVRFIVNYIKNVSPTTEIYVQSILPSKSGIRTLAVQQETNDSLRNICTQTNTTYVDLWDKLLPIATNADNYSLDGLHCTAVAYRTWCKEIEKYIGTGSTYPDDATVNYSGLSSSLGMRASTFAMHPVANGDILIIGDEMVHGGEWHELLGSNKVKGRGTGWGYPGTGIANITKEIPAILKGRDNNGEPAKIFLYAGTADANGSDAVSVIKTRYEALVATVRDNAPNAEIYILGLLPKNNATQNSNRVVPVNETLKEIAEANTKVTYVDDYTPLVKNGVANTDYFNGNYVYGKGYAKLAQVLANYMGDDVNPMTEAEAEAQYDHLTARNAVVAAIASIYKCTAGTGVGQYATTDLESLQEKLKEAYAALNATGTMTDQLNQMATSLNEAIADKIIRPTASTNDDEHWYKLFTPERSNLCLTGNGDGNNATGTVDNNYARSMWKFVTRTDGTYDIINRADNSYLNPASAYNTAIKTTTDAPAEGWTLSYSNTPGTFIISSGKVQLNQTQSSLNYVIYNWSSGEDGLDRNDAGCRYAIADAGDPTEEPVINEKPTLTLTDITLDGTKPYKVADDVAAKVFALENATVAIDFTLTTSTGNQILVGSSNSATNAIWATGIYNGQIVRVYTPDDSEGSYYSSGSVAIGTNRKQLVVTMKKGTGYTYYLDGFKLRDVNFDAPVFGSVDGVNGLYLGGIVIANNENLRPATGTIHSVRIYDHVLTADEVAALDYSITQPEDPEGDGILVNTTTGTLYRDNGTTNQNWNKTWKSNSTTPQLTLDADKNNMTSKDGYVVGYVGSQVTSCTYTLSAPVGYFITGWSMDFVQHQNKAAITLEAGGKAYTSTTESQHVAVSGLNKRTATFVLKGGNNDGIVFKNFRVTVTESGETAEPRSEIFITNSTDKTVVNRIPAIATAHNGNLLALSDYRYSGADIGMSSANDGKIDLRYSLSTDNGKTWSTIKTLAAAKGYTYGAATKDSLNAAFGDPCIVADRESARVLVLSCSGMVSFPNGTRTNHQGIARFYSEDNGETWSAATNIAESIYSQFDKRADGPVRAMFVGSGKISQSHSVKVGDYYRLYCAVLVKLNSGSNVNFVLYSDDFGGEWKVLGGVHNSPIPSGGDEPKADELPDGSVIISSRATGGRYFNIYTFTDSKTGEGYWNTQAFSGSSNKGTTATSNSTNGEIIFVPVIRKADNKKMYLALQSVPFGPNRANVGIYYKGLESPADYASTETFAANWEGSHQASDMNGAYSTMTWQQDNTLGFLFEESTYGRDYTIVYKNYSIEYLTDSAYTYDDAPNREAFAFPATALDARMEDASDMVGANVGNLKETGLIAIQTAYNAYVESPSQETYEAFAAAFANTDNVVTIIPKMKYRLRNSNRGNGNLYLVANTDRLTAATLDEGDGTQLFTFIPTDVEDTYLVYNETSDVYIGRTGADYAQVPVATEEEDIYSYTIASSKYGLSTLCCTTPVNRPAIHLSSDGTSVVPWNASDSPASLWYIEPTGITTDIGSATTDNVTTDASIYDLSGRRVLMPAQGIYIINGQKFIKR